MKIRVIVPVTTKEFVAATGPQYVAAARPDAEISVVGLDRGPASLESDYEDALAVPDILAKVRSAEAEGMDAVIIDCMADPGLSPARELASIPVIGPAQAAMHLAVILAHQFSVLTVLERDIPLIDRLAQLYGLEGNLASVRPVNIPVLELDRDRERLMEALVEQSARAIAEDGAHIIFPGCTGMRGLAQQVEQALADRGYAVPVIDPSLAALKLAEGLVDMGLSHSKRTYPPPPPKEIVGYPQETKDGPPVSRPGELRRRTRIRVIIPVVGERWIAPVQEAYGRAGRPGTEISAVAIDKGPASIESARDEALAVPAVLSRVRAAEAEGMDAVVLDCVADPGLDPARELASIPIIGPAQAAMHLAAMLAHRFSVITVLEQGIPGVHRQILRYGLAGKVASVRAINIPVLEMGEDRERVIQAVIEESAKAVREDGAHIIVPGCTEMIGMAPIVQEGLAEQNCEVPVIDAPAVAVKLAEGLVDMGLAHSKRTYPLPLDKEIVGYP
ncbi:MAG: aspartate/glutamate racemase family protein [Anaerolineae bacterium]